MIKLTQELALKYKQLREEDGLSRRAACAEIGVAESTMRGWERSGSYAEVFGGVVDELSTHHIPSCKTVLTKIAPVKDTLKHPLHRTNSILTSLSSFKVKGKIDKLVVEEPSKKMRIVVIADTQCKPTESLEYMVWIGKYIADKKPDVVVHIGDHYDFPSLSSYDKGKKSFEGRRLKADIEAGNEGLALLMKEINSVKEYNPRLVFCTGNHEDRFDRISNDMPELDGFVGTDTLPISSYGWEVYPFLKPAVIEDIYFVHYLANPFTGKPYGGSALNQLKNVGKSFVVGHKQCLDVAIRPTLDGRHQIGIINGACYPFDEGYKGHQGNNHFRGLSLLSEVEDGFGLPAFASLQYLKERYGQA